MAPPTAFKSPMRDALLGALVKGATYRDATAAAGIAWRTWCDWAKAVDKGGGHNDPDVDALVRAAREAYARASCAMVAQVQEAGEKDWRATAWLLDKRQGDAKARHDEKRARHEAEIAAARAKGTHVERIEHVGDPLDILRSRLARIADGDAAGDDPPRADDSAG
jgi:hypothetical protein